MFAYSVSIEDRLSKIQRLVSEGDHGIALVVAAADFERTIRRAIVGLASEPTADVRERIERKYNTIGRYGQGWTRFVELVRKSSLQEALPEIDDIKNAFRCRNKLVHGQQGGARLDYVTPRIEVIFSGTTKLTSFAREHGIDLTARIRIRQRPRNRQQQ
jgi:hypothetical protein